jgi:lipopolysaccharide heptosyltransferase II
MQGLGDIIRFIRELRDTRYDIAIDFQGLFKSGIVIGLARSVRKIGFDRTRELSYLFLNERMPAYDIERHALERYLDVARYLGAKDVSPVCTLPIDRERATVRKRLEGVKRPDQPLVVVNPVARWKTKLWQERNFAELADRLVREKNAAVIFTGSLDDRTMIDGIQSLMRERSLNWAGETTLKELAALASLSELFITTDTGPMHLAAASGARILALFGPTAPWRTGPYGESHIVMRTGIGCSPCFQRKCDRAAACMAGITVEEVMKRVPLV